LVAFAASSAVTQGAATGPLQVTVKTLGDGGICAVQADYIAPASVSQGIVQT
jgi:hypothetical protein